ncbi:MAG TPA: FG-GAP repeat protein, partial [Myxococcota bacterium]|nr:FG-GAP repeat protein [Myxococcota bacterium]
EDSSPSTGGACTPALSISPGSAQVLPFGLLQLQASGGTGARLWTLETNASGAVINPENGGYVAGSLSGAVDVVLLTDEGCEGEARLSIEVVGPLAVAPGDARVHPGQSIPYDVEGGSGNVACSFFANNSGGTLDGTCRYTAGSGEGIDRVLFEDSATGELVYRKIEVSNDAIYGIDGQGALFLPVGAWMEPAVHAGSGVVDITVESGPFRAEDGRLWADGPGEGVVHFTDHYTGDGVEVPVAALAARSPVLPRDGERAGGGSWHRLGDVNGDGYMDAAFAWIEPSIDAWYGGMVAVYAGSAEGLESSPVMVVSGQTPEETLGRGIAAGDVDNDGYVDLLIGADKTDRGGTNNGAVSIYRGVSTGFFESTPSRTLYGELAYDRLGSSLALGDFDG